VGLIPYYPPFHYKPFIRHVQRTWGYDEDPFMVAERLWMSDMTVQRGMSQAIARARVKVKRSMARAGLTPPLNVSTRELIKFAIGAKAYANQSR
jgi:hypothetical protein